MREDGLLKSWGNRGRGFLRYTESTSILTLCLANSSKHCQIVFSLLLWILLIITKKCWWQIKWQEHLFLSPTLNKWSTVSGVNKSIAQGNNQQMEYAKWNPKEGGWGTEGREGGRQTKRDWEFNIKHGLKSQSRDWIRTNEISEEGERRKRHVCMWMGSWSLCFARSTFPPGDLYSEQ